jgi:hypothetical protein
MVGLRVTKPRGQEWILKPATFRELSEAEAGFTTGLGKFSAKFEVKGRRVVVQWDTPKGTLGRIELPGKKTRWVKGGKGEEIVHPKH